MSKNQNAVIEFLLANGWSADGETARQSFRIPTTRSPVFGGVGGERVNLGGRPRFRLAGSNWFVTVGVRTVCFYRRRADAAGFLRYQTKDINAVVEAAAEIKKQNRGMDANAETD